MEPRITKTTFKQDWHIQPSSVVVLCIYNAIEVT